MMTSFTFRIALAASITLAPGSLAATAGKLPTPVATEFAILGEDDNGWSAGFVGEAGDERIGALVTCRPDGTLQAALFFGFFPPGKPVQAAARQEDGTVYGYGPVVTGGAYSGFHSPLIEDQELARRIVGKVFRNGTLLSNGHNSVWNRIPEAANEEARNRLMRCGNE